MMAGLRMNTDEDLLKITQIPEAISKEIAILKNSADSLVHHCNSRGEVDQQEFDPVLENLFGQVTTQNKQIAKKLKESYSTFEDELKRLTERISSWQKALQLFYAKLDLEPKPKTLEDIAKCCATTGLALHSLLSVCFEDWRNILERFDGQEIKEDYIIHSTAFTTLWRVFLQRTFIVIGQGDFVINKQKKCFPTFYLRLLAADYLNDFVGEVTPYFVSEVNLRQCVRGDELNIEDLKKKQIKVQNVVGVAKKKTLEKLQLMSQKGTAKMECACKNIAFQEDFERKQNKEAKVHEEKFRVVFVTEVESQTIWTLSLPLVVISATLQEVNSLASIMWQCFSTDVFSIHEETPVSMKWSSVAAMLKMKFATISKSHNLTEGNIQHLKEQLFDCQQPDDALVSLSLFCCDDKQRILKNIIATEGKDTKDKKETKVPYSFWKYFLGVFNVIEVYLKEYWNDGLIMAFAKRTEVKKMLLKCKNSGTFILRFSDTEIRDKIGVKNVQGRLKASVFCIKLKNSGGKRKGSEQAQLVEERVVEDLELGDPHENLAYMLKVEPKQLFCYLYPGDKTRQELFDKYIKHKENDDTNMADGYKKPCDVGLSVPDLELAVKQLNLLTGSSSQATPEFKSDSRVIKKAKRKDEQLKSDKSINDVYEHNTGPLESGEMAFESQSSVNSSFSPSYLEQSPEQSVPSFSYQMSGRHLNEDSVVPYSPDNYSCTAMEQGSYASGEKNGTELSFTNFTNKGGIASPWVDDLFQNNLDLSNIGASTQEIFNQPLTGYDDLISGLAVDNGISNEMAIECQYDGCQQLQNEPSYLENNTTLSELLRNELKEKLTPERYLHVLSWTQREIESNRGFQNRSITEEVSNDHQNMDDILGSTSEDLDAILSDFGFLKETGLEENDPSADGY